MPALAIVPHSANLTLAQVREARRQNKEGNKACSGATLLGLKPSPALISHRVLWWSVSFWVPQFTQVSSAYHTVLPNDALGRAGWNAPEYAVQEELGQAHPRHSVQTPHSSIQVSAHNNVQILKCLITDLISSISLLPGAHVGAPLTLPWSGMHNALNSCF